jgi:hypothetical protein
LSIEHLADFELYFVEGDKRGVLDRAAVDPLRRRRTRRARWIRDAVRHRDANSIMIVSHFAHLCASKARAWDSTPRGAARRHASRPS